MSALNPEEARRIYTLARKVVHQHGTWVPRSDISMYCGAYLYIELKEDTGKLTILAFDESGQPVEEPAFIGYADGRVDAFHPGEWQTQLQLLAEGKVM
ncbi:hypothetical protein HRbin16_02672 [bacterium HR16]|nr:hypothetical protein HRbin16_02672 [bacterium HR16]